MLCVWHCLFVDSAPAPRRCQQWNLLMSNKWPCPNATSNKELIISAKIFVYATFWSNKQNNETQNKTFINICFNNNNDFQ